MRLMAAAQTKVLVQTHISKAVARQFDALAKATGHKRAGYLRYLIEMHVEALTPKLARALQRAQPTKSARGLLR